MFPALNQQLQATSASELHSAKRLRAQEYSRLNREITERRVRRWLPLGSRHSGSTHV